ncbi:hypothetical protein [Mycobacterium intracellulare]|uniref:hypothetical protein n=1 Tax=Mycobacterium intracellulare TaxID=1767 RepID=UPI001915217E|nr:hypothetical protein [Mycobacterium intracellulare]MCA2359584.1 hypothetical protein [Mycobacterium intracellulare]MCA2369466.1 hypothetical protein [Mycobacterium intracellulare]
MASVKLGTQAIGAAGELLVQYQLLKLGIDSARLTTDSGIDLVMYVPGSLEAHTVQVKARFQTESAGGRGHPTMGWSFPEDCKAQWLAGVDLSRDLVWLFRLAEARELAQQRRADGGMTLYWYLEDSPRRRVPGLESEFEAYRLESVVTSLLAEQSRELP